MNIIVKFFHELMNPHCPHCEQLRMAMLEQRELDREVASVCKSCENLKMELAKAHQLTDRMLEKLTEKPELGNTLPQEQEPRRILQPNQIPWGVRRQKLEQDSRIEANRLKDLAENKAAKPDIKALENELGIGEVEQVTR